MPRRVVLFQAVALFLASTAPCSAAATRSMTMQLGYLDSSAHADEAPLMVEARADGATFIRIFLRWAATTRARPSAPADPSDPAYDWTSTDDLVAAARAQGLRVVLNITTAPAFAEGAGRPASAALGAWRPNAHALGEFATAAARHYAGQVRQWQVWNEPNLDAHLAPQYVGRRQTSAGIYRGLLNAAYAGIKSVDPGATVISGGTAPYGDAPGDARTRPVTFWRALLSRRTHLDGWAHHPYGIGGPRQHAVNRNDAAIPDVGRVGSVVRKAVRGGTALPKRTKPGWVTEFSWDSDPPDPDGVPEARRAHWLSGALMAFWRAGVTRAAWFGIDDQLPEPSYAATYQSGTHLADGTPKLADQAFRFPFAAGRPHNGRATIFALPPATGTMVIQRRYGSAWRTVLRRQRRRGQVLDANVPARAGTTFRARQGGRTSLIWRVGVDG